MVVVGSVDMIISCIVESAVEVAALVVGGSVNDADVCFVIFV